MTINIDESGMMIIYGIMFYVFVIEPTSKIILLFLSLGESTQSKPSIFINKY